MRIMVDTNILLSALDNPTHLSLPLSTFTKKTNFNYSYLCREFKKNVGMSMTKYFNMKKMQYANTLLLSTSLSIEEICELIGINNIPYFYKLYKQTYGTTPKNKRKINE